MDYAVHFRWSVHRRPSNFAPVSHKRPISHAIRKVMDPMVNPIMKRVLSLVIKEVLPTPFEPNKATLNISNDINPISP